MAENMPETIAQAVQKLGGLVPDPVVYMTAAVESLPAPRQARPAALEAAVAEGDATPLRRQRKRRRAEKVAQPEAFDSQAEGFGYSDEESLLGTPELDRHLLAVVGTPPRRVAPSTIELYRDSQASPGGFVLCGGTLSLSACWLGASSLLAICAWVSLAAAAE